MTMQLDVTDIQENIVLCRLYTSERSVQMVMKRYDYDNLLKEGFFIRDGKERDSANVLNTTEVYHLKKEVEDA